MVGAYVYIAELKYPGDDVESNIVFSSLKSLFDYYGEEIIGMSYKYFRFAWDTNPNKKELVGKFVRIKRYKYCAGKCDEVLQRIAYREQNPIRARNAAEKARMRIMNLGLGDGFKI